MSAMLAITYTKITKTKVADWGTPKFFFFKFPLIFVEKVNMIFSVLIPFKAQNLLHLYSLATTLMECSTMKFFLVAFQT
jgi:hypothetical protein